MEFLPRTLGTRPRLACEIRAEGVVAARAEDGAGLLSAVLRASFAEGAVAPGLRPGNIVERSAVVAAVRKVLEAVVLKTREVTLVVPDAAVRVLLLDFDALPGKEIEAMPVVRFRLKKLLPFDADDAALSYQVMSSTRSAVRVLAVAMPREVLAEYEGVVREAGFEPGAVLPSTLAAVAGLAEGDGPVLVVNAGPQGVTTAIVSGGLLLLHRSVDLVAREAWGVAASGMELDAVSVSAVNLMDRMVEGVVRPGVTGSGLALVDREESEEEWAMQEAVGEGSERLAAEAAMQRAELDRGTLAERAGEVRTSELAQAVSVTAAWFEDNLESVPAVVRSAGTLGAAALAAVLGEAGVGPMPVVEMVDSAMLGAGATSAGSPGGVPFGWLAGVRGALAN